MKKSLLIRILTIVLAVALIFAFSTTAFAYYSITGVEFHRNGLYEFNCIVVPSSTYITQAMSPPVYPPQYPYGELYASYSKAVALRDAQFDEPIYNYIERVRVYPVNYGSDLRINPYASSNWVGLNQSNYEKQVKGVQTILVSMGYLGDSLTDWSEVDGICGSRTRDAIGDFQEDHNIPRDEIVGPITWRALCSSASFQYGYTGW